MKWKKNEFSFSGCLWRSFGIIVTKCPEPWVKEKADTQIWLHGGLKTEQLRRNTSFKNVVFINDNSKQDTQTVQRRDECSETTRTIPCHLARNMINVLLLSPILYLSIVNMRFSQMLHPCFSDDFTSLPQTFILTRGPILINVWTWSCTKRQAESWQAGS